MEGVKVKVLRIQATEALRAGRSIALPYLRPRHWRWGWGSAPRPGRFTAGKGPVPIVQEAGWAPRPVRTGAENLAPDPRTVQPIASCYTDWAIPAAWDTERHHKIREDMRNNSVLSWNDFMEVTLQHKCNTQSQYLFKSTLNNIFLIIKYWINNYVQI